MEAATCRLPKLKQSFQQLEVKSQRYLNDTRVAAQDLVRMQEVGRQWRDLIQRRQARRVYRIDRVYRSRNVLRVIESIEEISAELDLLRFAEPEVLDQRNVEVVNRR